MIGPDGPIAWHDPLTTMEIAITRREQGGQGDALSEQEGVDLATTIKAMTLDSAYLMNQDQQVGSIEVGKRADMIVVDQNLFDISATKIGATNVLLTVLDGRVVYDAASSPVSEKAIEEKFGVELDFSGEHSRPSCQVMESGA